MTQGTSDRSAVVLPPRINVLGVGVHPINMGQALDAIERWIARGEKHYVCLTPIHSILACQDDPDMKRVFNQSGLTTPDGMPLVWISRASGHHQANRVYGPDVMRSVSQRSVALGYRHFLLGGHPGVPERVQEVLESDYPGIQVVGRLSPAFGEMNGEQDAELVAEINAASPDIVWVALGSPRQEKWMAEHVQALNAHVLIGVGAAFDFLSGRKPHAPRWIQRSGLEWLFRLASEPRRLWRRYLRYPIFTVMYAAQLLGLKRYVMIGVGSPSSEVPNDPRPSPPGQTSTAGPVGRLARADIFGVQISALTVADLHQIIAAAVETNTRALLPNVNAHALNLAYETPWLRDFFNQSTAVFPDGSGALFAARVQGGHFQERVTYADWMWDLARFCAERGFSLYFLGGRDGVAAEAADTLRGRFADLRVAGTHEGYFDKSSESADNAAVLAEINRLQPDVLIVGFGMPLQERWLKDNWDRLDVRVGLTGGAVFDYISGRLRRPPRFLADHGLEWFGRLLIEPGRLWRRYLLGIPQFTWRVVLQRLRHGRS